MRRRVASSSKFGRPWKIEVYQGGALVIRHEREMPRAGVLLVCSVETKADAESIQVGCCSLSRVDNETYRLNPVFRNDKDSLELEDLPALGDRLLAYLARVKALRARKGGAQ